ncbi:unnamed protein product [Absidia cylindrospora]
MVLTLECLLSDTTSEPFKAFSAYLQQQYCTENLMFWLAVERYKENYQRTRQTILAHTSDDDDKNNDQIHHMIQQCMVIIYTYIQPNSCREINIPCDMRHAIIDKVGTDYHPDLFIPACEAVLELMRANAFIPWLTQWDPSMLPTPPTPISSSSSSSSLNSPPTSSAMVSSLSSPDGWNVLTADPTSSPRPSVSSFRSTNDIVSPFSSKQQQQQQQRQRRVGGLSYQSMLKRMKNSFFNNTSKSPPNPIRRSSLTWPSTSNRKK